MNKHQRWAVAIGALLLAAIVGAIAYNIGVNVGSEGEPYPYRGWHRRAHERMWNGEREQDDPDRRR